MSFFFSGRGLQISHCFLGLRENVTAQWECHRSQASRGSLRPRAEVGKSKGTTEARGGGREDQPHGQGSMAARAQEGLEELFHTEGQEGRQ